MFDKIKDFAKLAAQMRDIKKRLDETLLELETADHGIKITITGSQEIKKISFASDPAALDRTRLEADLVQLVNKAIRDSQATAASQMGSMQGLLNG
ncbi:MAG: YbaB/EbfC family nucleoid-associated protein [Elusimicrobiaceae bacterium]|nr:YbaB/EbfC family nucleoid-associated protein [Elusimicrobiaceae bacterium]